MHIVHGLCKLGILNVEVLFSFHIIEMRRHCVRQVKLSKVGAQFTPKLLGCASLWQRTEQSGFLSAGELSSEALNKGSDV